MAVHSGLNFVSCLPLTSFIFFNKLPIALGVGRKVVSDKSSRLALQHDGSEYSEGQRQLALGLEEIKFFREIGEGDTPSTAVDEMEYVSVADAGSGDSNTLPENALCPEDNLADQFTTLPLPEYTAKVLPMLSRRALKGILDHRDTSELPSRPKPGAKRMEGSRNESAVPPQSHALGSPGSRDKVGASTEDGSPRSSQLGQTSTKTPKAPEIEISAPDTTMEMKSRGNTTLGSHTPDYSVPTVTTGTLLPLVPTSVGPSVSSSSLLESSPPQFYHLSIPTNGRVSVPSPPQTDPKIRALVVDDDALTRRLMQRMLSRLGCTVDTAENGKIALGKILGEPISPGILSLEHVKPLSRSLKTDGARISHVYHYDVIFLDNQMVSLSECCCARSIGTLIGVDHSACHDWIRYCICVEGVR